MPVTELDDATRRTIVENPKPAGSIDIGDGKNSLIIFIAGANKLMMNRTGNTMYLAGNSGTNVVSVKGKNVKKAGPTRNDRTGITVRGGENSHLMLHEPNSNNLVLYDNNFNAVKRLDGQYESGPVNEHFNDYRYSLDDIYFLWRSGNGGLTIVDAETFEPQETINNFWSYNEALCQPLAACANRAGTKICGTSQAGPNAYILHYYEDRMDGGPPISYAKPVVSIIPSMYQVTCMDVSNDERRVYIAGMARMEGGVGRPIVVACGFDERLVELSAVTLKDLDYGTPRRLKRLKGSEVLVVACNRHFSFLECRGSQLYPLGSIADVHENEICDFEVRGNYLYSKAYGESVVKVTELNAPKAPKSSVTVSRLSSANDLYRNVRTNQIAHEAFDNLEKIVATPNGARVYAGGRGLHILDRQNNALVPTDVDTTKSNKNPLINFRHYLLRIQNVQLQGSSARAQEQRPRPAQLKPRVRKQIHRRSEMRFP